MNRSKKQGRGPAPAPVLSPSNALHPSAPELAPDEGWVPIDPDVFRGRRSTFVSGPGNGNRVRLRYYRCDPAGTVAGKVWFGPDAEGRAGHAHSGSIAAVLEEAMALAGWLSGFTAAPVAVTVQYRDALPLGLVCTIGSWVSNVEDDRIRTQALLAGPAGQTFAEATGLYLLQDPPGIDRSSQCATAQARSA